MVRLRSHSVLEIGALVMVEDRALSGKYDCTNKISHIPNSFMTISLYQSEEAH
jgi:hypothetical protein